MRFVDMSFYYNRGETDGYAIVQRHRVNLEYVRYLPPGCQCSVIKFMDKEAHFTDGSVDFHFYRGSVSGIYPNRALSFLKSLQPDVVLMHGLIYPWQVYLVRKTVGKPSVLAIQHHGETVPGGWRKWLIKEADRYVDRYFFTSTAIASAWIQEGIIGHPGKVAEVLTGSSAMTIPESMTGSQVIGDPVLLWVGRLDHNKDPVTVVEGFALLLKTVPTARLYMIYQSEETPGALQSMLDDSLRENVTLVGAVNNAALAHWYLAADFFVAGSHREACGYALLEAMSCGCIPVVTNIPSFRKITDGGRFGFLYEPGDAGGFVRAMENALKADREMM